MNLYSERNQASETEVSASWNEGTTLTGLCEDGTDNEREISEDYLLGSEARPDPYSKSQSETELNSNLNAYLVLSEDNPTEGSCNTEMTYSPSSTDNTNFSSNSRSPSPSNLRSRVNRQESGLDALDMSCISAELGMSSGTLKSVKTPGSTKATKDSSHTRTPSAQSSTSKGNLQATRLEDINMLSDSEREQQDINHDGVSVEENANDGNGGNNDDDYRPTTQEIDQIEPVTNDSDHSDGHLTSCDISEHEADVSCEGDNSSPQSEASFNHEGRMGEIGSSIIVNNNSRMNIISARRIPRGQGSFKCPSCPKVYAYTHNLKRHVKRTHSRRGSQCFKTGKNDVQSRRNTTRTIRKGKGSVCSVCPKVYAYKNNVKRHVELAHSSRVSQGIKRGKNNVQSTKESGRVFNCKECSVSYTRKCDLVRHMNYKHKASDQDMNGNVEYALRSSPKDLLFRCREERCTKRFPSRRLLDIHLRGSHRNNELNNNGDLHENLQHHVHEERASHGTDEYQPPVAETVLANHQDREEIDRGVAEVVLTSPSLDSFYKYQLCAKEYFRKCDLTKHMKSKHNVQRGGQAESGKDTHTEVKGISVGNVYQRKKCQQGFSTNSDLPKLVNQHRQDSPKARDEPRPTSSSSHYNDKVCSKRFLKKALRGVHEAECNHDRHQESNDSVEGEISPTSKVRVFQCKKCQRTFSRKSDLTRHMKRCKHPIRKRKISVVSEDRVPSAPAMKYGKHKEHEEEGIHLGRGIKRATAPCSSKEGTISSRSVTNECAVAADEHENLGNNDQDDGSGPARHEIQSASTRKRYKRNIREMYGDQCNQGTEEGSSGLSEEELPDANADQCTESLNSHSSGKCNSPMPMHRERHQTEISADDDNVPSTSAGPAAIQGKRRSVADVATMTKTDQCCRFCNKTWLEVLHDHELDCVEN